MHQIIIEYEGRLRTRAKHLQSGNEIFTDAPIDNNGKGEAFSPTDLAVAALGSCILTIMGIAAENRGIDLMGTHSEITKVMGKKPRRICKVQIIIYFKNNFSDKVRKILEIAAHSCPVHKSLHPEIKKEIIFQYPKL